MDGWMCWMGRRRQGLEEYVPLPYSPPSSACRLVPGTPVAPFAQRARIPAQEFGRWTTSPLRNSIARLKSTPLCAIPLPLSPARIRCCSSRRRGRLCRLHARTHPCSRIGMTDSTHQRRQPRTAPRYTARPRLPSLLKNSDCRPILPRWGSRWRNFLFGRTSHAASGLQPYITRVDLLRLPTLLHGSCFLGRLLRAWTSDVQ